MPATSSYGEFSPDGREYVVVRPDTPRPWVNYLSNERFCSLCSATGGGYCFVNSSGFERITRQEPHIVRWDRPGRYLYLRDAVTGKFWSATWQPVLHHGPPEWFEARHGQGYTSVSSRQQGIEHQLTFFVPRQDNLEVWLIRLRNPSRRRRRLQLFAFVDWCPGNFAWNMVESSFSPLFIETSFSQGMITLGLRFWNVVSFGAANPNLAWDKRAFMAASFPVDSFDCSAEKFFGTYRDWACPQAVERGHCSGSLANGETAVGVLQHDFELGGRQQEEMVVLVGVGRDAEEIQRLAGKYLAPASARQQLDGVRRYWDDYLHRTWAETPDPDFDLSFNIWNKYQAWVTSRWSRMDSYYVGGGSILGFRDSWQDLLAALVNDSDWARGQLFYLLEHQCVDGSTLHNWDPESNVGLKTGHSDDPLWLVFGLISYLKESGDFGMLERPVRFYDGPPEPVYQHLVRAVEYTWSRRSERGLPLMMAADWNDALDQVGREGEGESVMVAEQLCWVLPELAEVARRQKDPERAERFTAWFSEMKDLVNRLCWDGKWFWRATTDQGQVLGTARNAEATIWLNPQAWAIIGRVPGRERATTCMDSVHALLDTEYGPALFRPAYSSPDPNIGIITRFCPGTKENGTIFNHPVCWAVMAECMLGRGDRAYQLWKKTSFVTRGRQPETYRAEPYVYSEYVNGPDSPQFGQGEFSWLTGTASWMWKVCLEWMLGARADWDGLLIDPCLPRSWKRLKLRRPFRGAIYEIKVENPHGLEKGRLEVTLDDYPIKGNLLPPLVDGQVHQVRVVIRPR